MVADYFSYVVRNFFESAAACPSVEQSPDFQALKATVASLQAQLAGIKR